MNIRLATGTLIAVSTLAQASHPLGADYGWESVVVGTASNVIYGSSHDFVFDSQGQPVVIYFDEISSALLEVRWSEDRREVTKIGDVGYGFHDVSLSARGNKVALIYQMLADQHNGSIWFSERTESGWTEPELVTRGRGFIKMDLELDPSGDPVLAISGAVRSGVHATRLVGVCTRGPGGWSLEPVYTPSDFTGVSTLELAVDPAGIPHIAFRESSSLSGGAPARIKHAHSTTNGWLIEEVFEIPGDAQLTDICIGKSGSPIILDSGRYTEYLSPRWSSPVPVGGTLRYPACAAVSPAGHAYVANEATLLTNLHGTWSSHRIPYATRVRCDSLGRPHLLGIHKGLLVYHHPVMSDWQPETIEKDPKYTTRLQGVASSPGGEPQVFAFQYQSQSGTITGSGPVSLTSRGHGWTTKEIDHPYWESTYALDNHGRIHVLSGATTYSTGTLDSMESERIPISSTAFSSDDVSAIATDSLGHPHVSMIIYEDNNDWGVYYGVKRGDDWQIERVDGLGNTRHSAIALDPAGQPWILCSTGLYQRNDTGWINRFPLTHARNPKLVIGSDSTIDGVFINGGLRAITGRGGDYSTTLLDSSPYDSRPDLTLLGDEPISVFVTQWEYPRVHSLRLARRTGEVWRIENIDPIRANQEYGDSLHISTNTWDEVFIACATKSVVNSNIIATPELRRGSFSRQLPPAVGAETIPLTRVRHLKEGVLLEIVSEPGARYAVDYSDSPGTWNRSPTTLIATSARVRWIDCGPPQTHSHPRMTATRLYRIRRVDGEP